MTQQSDHRGGGGTVRSDGAPSIIASGLRIVGNVASGGVVHIEGEVYGDVQCAELTVGPKGRVEGQASASAVVVLGAVTGTIRAKSVRIARGATVIGEVIHERLAIEAGARVDGYYRPVARIEPSPTADVRRQAGLASPGEPVLPRRSLPPFRKRSRSAGSLRQPQGLTLKPLH